MKFTSSGSGLPGLRHWPAHQGGLLQRAAPHSLGDGGGQGPVDEYATGALSQFVDIVFNNLAFGVNIIFK